MGPGKIPAVNWTIPSDASPKVLRPIETARPLKNKTPWAPHQEWREICPELTIRSTFNRRLPRWKPKKTSSTCSNWLTEAPLDASAASNYSAVDGAPPTLLAQLSNPEEVKRTLGAL